MSHPSTSYRGPQMGVSSCPGPRTARSRFGTLASASAVSTFPGTRTRSSLLIGRQTGGELLVGARILCSGYGAIKGKMARGNGEQRLNWRGDWKRRRRRQSIGEREVEERSQRAMDVSFSGYIHTKFPRGQVDTHSGAKSLQPIQA